MIIFFLLAMMALLVASLSIALNKYAINPVTNLLAISLCHVFQAFLFFPLSLHLVS